MQAHRRLRLVAPVAVVGAIALGSWGTTIRASASPDLPAITPAHLITKALHADVKHFSGTVSWNADAGLPSLSSVTAGGGQSVPTSSGFDPTALVSGTHDFQVATDTGGRLRVSSSAPLQESDLVVNGHQAWVSESSTGHVVHYVASGAGAHGSDPTGMHGTGDAVTPAALADHLLANVRAWSTAVTTTSPIDVAGHAAYQLVLTPDRASAAGASSTVSSVDLAIDASTGMPLRVTVRAVGQAAPALQLGFTSLSYAEPAASTFAGLTGLTTTTKTVDTHAGSRHSGGRPAAHAATSGNAGTSLIGSRWSTIVDVAPATAAKALATNRSEIDAVTTVVSGPWGSGRMLSSSLLNALVLPDGRVLAGFVTPAALEHAASGLR